MNRSWKIRVYGHLLQLLLVLFAGLRFRIGNNHCKDVRIDDAEHSNTLTQSFILEQVGFDLDVLQV